MKLSRDAIKTTEVLEWKGLHLLNFSQSSCSQKVRILLSEKKIPYTSHEINLRKAEQTTPWYLGINSRGVVPVLVHDGDVHVESNDLLQYIDSTFPSPGVEWFPKHKEARDTGQRLLDLEEALHVHLRTITMGFLLPKAIAKKSEEELAAYAKNGDDDDYRQQQIDWWRAFGERGVTEQQAQEAVAAFHDAFTELDTLLTTQTWLLGSSPSVTDIAWFITLYRADLAGYPLEVHPNLYRSFLELSKREAFRKEVKKGPLAVHVVGPAYRLFRRLTGTSLKASFNRWKSSASAQMSANVHPLSASKTGSAQNSQP